MRILPCFLCLVTVVISTAEADLLIGTQFTARNTIQVEEPLATAFGLPAGIEVDFVPTTAPAPVVAGGAPELNSFATVYDIDIDDRSVVFTFNPSPTSPVTPRVLEAGTFDRYYFDFTFPDPATQIGLVEFDITNSNILPSATATPTITRTSGSSFMVELGPGNAVLPGFVHAYSISAVPEPSSALLFLGGLVLMPVRRRRRDS